VTPDDDRILGIPELDPAIATALPPGWMAVLSGPSGSGAPLLAKQFANAGVGTSPVLFYTTYERTRDVEEAFEAFGWDPSSIKIVNLADEYYDRVLMRGLEVAQAREQGLTLDQMRVDRPKDRVASQFSLTSRMLSDLASIDTPFRLVLDSVDFFLEVLEPAEVTTVARQIRYRCQTVGGQALLAVHSRGHEPAFTGALEDLADIVFNLTAEPKGTRYETTLYVEKVRNRPDLQRIARARIGPGGWTLEDEPPAPG
jgi:KaiC/GvpD/RAD55 family RecA-like ATPase